MPAVFPFGSSGCGRMWRWTWSWKTLMPPQMPSTIWRRYSGPRPGKGRRRRFSGRLEWVFVQSLSTLLLSFCIFCTLFYVYLKLFVLYVISPLFKGVFLGGKVSGPEGCLMFDLFSFLAAVPRGWRVLGLWWTSSEENGLTTTLVQPLWNNRVWEKELFYNSPFMWSLGMTDEWTFKQLCILEMNDKN